MGHPLVSPQFSHPYRPSRSFGGNVLSPSSLAMLAFMANEEEDKTFPPKLRDGRYGWGKIETRREDGVKCQQISLN